MRKALLIALLLAGVASGQRIQDLPEITADGITTDANILFGTDNTGDSTSYKLSLEELKKTGVQVVNVKQHGAVGDGVTDDTTALSDALTAASGGTLYIPDGVFGVSSALTVPANTTVIFDAGASLKKLSGTGNVLLLNAANITLVDATVDLNSVGTRGISISSSSSNVRLLGTTTVKSAASGGSATDGAVLCSTMTGLVIERLIVTDCELNPGSAGTYRGLDLSTCTDVTVGSVSVDTGDIGVNVYASTNVSLGQLVFHTLSANGLYIKDATSKVVVGTVEAKSVANGLTLDSSVANAQVVIGTALIATSTYGVDYRTSGGYLISNLHLVEAPLATTTAGSRSGLTIGTLRSYYAGASYRAINLDTANYVTLQSVDISCDAPLSGYAAYFVDCNYLTIGHIVINGIGASSTTEGVRFAASAVTAPVITVGGLGAHRVTTSYTVQSSITDTSSVKIAGEVNRYGGQTWQQKESVVFSLKNLNNAVLSGNDLGEYNVYGSDATSPGTKFRMLTEATDNSGASRTYIYNDNATLVGIIPAEATNSGMSIKLPTSSTGLSSGMIYNNAGTITIVP